jgi:hypothetical protein
VATIQIPKASMPAEIKYAVSFSMQHSSRAAPFRSTRTRRSLFERSHGSQTKAFSPRQRKAGVSFVLFLGFSWRVP